ncbi:AAA family ATPase [Candidatus Poribacteria bacterium]|nr:AAA family ATPase [Candidatus Poribacteria bacterium]
MKLTEFRVCMYKGIIDSGWVDVNDLTVLVGKNESGKTSLLKALHKLNPYKSETEESESYNNTKEWPRGRRVESSEEHVVCRAKFQLSDEEKTELAQIAEGETLPETVEVSRNYAGQLEIDLGEEIRLDEPSFIDINEVLDVLPEVPDNLDPDFRGLAFSCLDEVRSYINERRFDELVSLAKHHDVILRGEGVLPDYYSYSDEEQFINQYLEVLNRLARDPQLSRPAQSKVHQYINEHLPTFVYIDGYRTFRGNAHLEDVRTRQEGNRLTEEDKTFLMILRLSDLDLNRLVDLGLGDDPDRLRERQHDVEDGATVLTKKLSSGLTQRDYEVEYRVDGPYFFICVKDNIDPSLIDLEARSKGYQWYFSFDLMMRHEVEDTFKGCVILLDEPGLHLHPKAQGDLLKLLEKYSEGNTLLYTTHLPFMIDLNHPDRIRILKETSDEGIIVKTDLTETSPESRLPLQAALGIDLSQKYLIEKRNLVVEGTGDYWVLTELSNLFRRSEMEGIPEDVLIAAGGGASQAVPLAGLMIAQNLDVVVLFDSDFAGREAHDKLVKKWLTQYKETHTEVVMLGEAVGAEHDFELEDLFSEDFMKGVVKETYSKELANVDVADMILQGQDQLWDRLARYLKDEKGIENPNKDSVAKRVRDRLGKMKNVSELPEETEERVIMLFQTIRKAFGEDESKSA